MSHGDRVTKLPPGFKSIGHSPNAPVCVIADEARRFYGLQFHPEPTAEVLEVWLGAMGGAAELAALGVNTDALMTQTHQLASVSAPRAHELVRRFVRQVATAPVVSPVPVSANATGITRHA